MPIIWNDRLEDDENIKALRETAAEVGLTETLTTIRANLRGAWLLLDTAWTESNQMAAVLGLKPTPPPKKDEQSGETK